MIACVIVLAAGLAGLAARAVAIDLATPRDLHAREYVGSGECRRCHDDHHESWSRTFHRTMTQEAGEESVLGAFDGRSLQYGGIDARMLRDGEQFVIETLGERWVIDRTVGSRRYQQYLARRGPDEWVRLPIAWDVEEQRFFHMNAAFLTPDPASIEADTVHTAITRADYERHVTRWNDNCVFCHNVAPDPALDPDTGRFATEVAELGIGCEACHGPGSEHVAVNSHPLRRYVLHAGDEPDPTIVSPSRLDPARRADLCGRCHGQRITDDVGAFLAHGDPFVPGDDLALYSSPLWHDTTIGEVERAFEPRFWGDGTARLTAYEYQGLLQSRCAVEGSLTCTDCHAMHEGDPRGQIRPSVEGDAMCAGACHAGLADPAAALAHAGHDAPVSCVDCHMPRIVYGVRGVHRSHRIDVPRPIADAAAGRVDACRLCHLDAVASESARTIAAPGDVDREAAWELALSGDPIQRTVVLDAIGRQGTHGARPARLGILVSTMRHDAYPAVRWIAWRALRKMALVDLEPTAFTATDAPRERAAALAAILARLGEPVREPEPARAAALRDRARAVAIEIGE